MSKTSETNLMRNFELPHVIAWTLVGLLTMVPVFLTLLQSVPNGAAGIAGINKEISQLSGLVGTVLYAISLVLSTRLRFLEPMFGGLSRVYIAHHIVGALAFIGLMVHPLFVALALIPEGMRSAALSLIPNGLLPLSALFNTHNLVHEAVLEQWAITFGIIGFWGMVVMLMVTLFVKLPYQLWLFIHKFLGVAFLISGLHIFFIYSDTSEIKILRYYMLAMVILGLMAYTYKTLLGSFVLRRYRYSVESSEMVADDIIKVTLRPHNQRVTYTPGQFVYMRLLDLNGEPMDGWHPFSISSSSNDPYLELCIKSLGDFTKRLLNLGPGMEVEIEGAYGRFSFVNYKCRDQVWIAGGIGITPFLSMLKDLPDQGYRVYLFYCVSTASEFVSTEVLNMLALQKQNSLRIIPYASDQQGKHLTADDIEAISGAFEGKDFYLCGPGPMMQSFTSQLKVKGVAKSRIHSEEFELL